MRSYHEEPTRIDPALAEALDGIRGDFCPWCHRRTRPGRRMHVLDIRCGPRHWRTRCLPAILGRAAA